MKNLLRYNTDVDFKEHAVRHLKSHAVLLLFLLFFFSSFDTFSQGLRQDFNIRQKIKFVELEKLAGEHYEIIYAKNNLLLAKDILEIANENTIKIENLLGYRLSGKIEIRVFENPLAYEISKNTLSDHLNIQQNTGGNTVIVQNNFDIKFDGNRAALQSQIRAGIANALLYEMLYGGTVQEKIKYASLLQLPNWFIHGLVAYIANPWNAQDDDNLRDLILSKEKFQISDLQPDLQSLIGKNIWIYMSLLKGESAFQRILYLVRLTRKIENATYFVFNWNTSELIREWHNFILGSYAKDQKRKLPQQSEKLPLKKGKIIAVIKSNDIYYLQEWVKNESCIFKYNINTKTTFKISPSSKVSSQLRPIYCADGAGGLYELSIWNAKYNLSHFNGVKWIKLKWAVNLDFVNSFQYHPTTKTFLIAGLIKSDNVLISYKEKESAQVLFMSEQHIINPIWHQSGDRIVFASLVNHTKTNDFNYDVFELFLQDHNGQILLNHTNTNSENEVSPTYYGLQGISYLSDKNGIVNSYLKQDPILPTVQYLTDYQRNIQLVYYDMPNAEVIEVLKINGTYQWFVSSIDTATNATHHKSLLSTYFKEKSFVKKEIEISLDSTIVDTDTVDIGIYFQTDFPEEVDFRDVYSDSLGNKNIVDGFEPFVIRNPSYLHLQLLITQLDNSWFNTYYVPTFKMIDEALLIPIGLNIALNYRELDNKYNLALGARIARNFNQFGYFLKLDAFKFNIPFKVDLFRQSKRLFRPNDSYNKVISSQVSIAALIYAKKNLNVNIGWVNRYDVHDILSANEITLKQKNVERNYTGPSVEVVYNNSKEKNTNIFIGSKIKFYGQAFVNTSQKGNLNYIGIDARNGLDLGRNFFWMNRFQMEVSSGTQKVTYLAGGMENWLYPSLFSNEVLLEANGYYRMVSSIRGFGLNHRNGNAFSVINSEIRYKPIGSLFYLNTRSEFINNLLIVGLTDIAAVWYGKSPYDIRSPLNTSHISTGALDIIVYNKKQPILLGMGFGFRTAIFSYYLKFDQAWGYDNGVWGQPYQYLTIGKDF